MNKQELFLVWETKRGTEDGYFLQYDSLEKAVSNHGDGIEIYHAVPKLLGTYTTTVRLVKNKKGKKK